jgi:hypothetical protein
MNKEHPKDVGLTYWQHLKFAWGECFRLGCMEFVMFVHGLIPWVWDWKYSQFINEAKKRIDPQHENRKKHLYMNIKE